MYLCNCAPPTNVYFVYIYIYIKTIWLSAVVIVVYLVLMLYLKSGAKANYFLPVIQASRSVKQVLTQVTKP